MRPILAAASISSVALILTACGGSSPGPAATTAGSIASTAAGGSGAASAECTLQPGPDLILRVKTPSSITAQLVGSSNLAECKPTVDTLAETTSTQPGFCTWAARASDNPGYNVNAVPARPLRKVITHAGKGC